MTAGRECDTGTAGTSGVSSGVVIRTGMVRDRFSSPIIGVCFTIPGDADDHDIGVVVVDALHGLVELDSQVDGLLIELPDLFDTSGCLEEEAAASACSSGMRRGGRSTVRLAEVVGGMTVPKMASLSVSKEVVALLEDCQGRAARAEGVPSYPLLRSSCGSIRNGTSCDKGFEPKADLFVDGMEGTLAEGAVAFNVAGVVIDRGIPVGLRRG